MMMESMNSNGSTDACDIYGNVFMFALGAKSAVMELLSTVTTAAPWSGSITIR